MNSLEKAVTSLMLAFPACVMVASMILREEDFSTEMGRGIFRTLDDMDAQGADLHSVDALTVRKHLEQAGVPIEEDLWMELLDCPADIQDFPSYVGALHMGCTTRCLRHAGDPDPENPHFSPDAPE